LQSFIDYKNNKGLKTIYALLICIIVIIGLEYKYVIEIVRKLKTIDILTCKYFYTNHKSTFQLQCKYCKIYYMLIATTWGGDISSLF